MPKNSSSGGGDSQGTNRKATQARACQACHRLRGFELWVELIGSLRNCQTKGASLLRLALSFSRKILVVIYTSPRRTLLRRTGLRRSTNQPPTSQRAQTEIITSENHLP